MLELNEVKKGLYKSKEMATFSHYVSGNIYYTVNIESGTYQFPISTVEDGGNGIRLSEDLGSTTFSNEMKGSELIRWIGKAIKNEEFIKVG